MKAPSIRRAFIPRGESKKLICIDFKNIEYRLLAHFSKDRRLIEIFKNGEDFHGEVAKELGVDRDTAKRFNFAEVYGAGIAKLALSTGLSQKKCRNVRQRYKRKYPAVPEFKDSVEDYICRHGGIRNPLGRWRDIPPDMAYIGPNTLIQGTAADILKIALIRLYQFLKNKRSKMLIPIHDEVLIEWNPLDGPIVYKIVQLMETFKIKGRNMFRVPIEVDVSVCDWSWESKRDVGFVDQLEWIFGKEERDSGLFLRFGRDPYKRKWKEVVEKAGEQLWDRATDGNKPVVDLLRDLEELIDEHRPDKELCQRIRQWAKKYHVTLPELPRTETRTNGERVATLPVREGAGVHTGVKKGKPAKGNRRRPTKGNQRARRKAVTSST